MHADHTLEPIFKHVPNLTPKMPKHHPHPPFTFGAVFGRTRAPGRKKCDLGEILKVFGASRSQGFFRRPFKTHF